MRDRCFNPNADHYARYGGRGITVCERWSKFENFLTDMGQMPSGGRYTIERINNDGNYEPTNCRWATYKEQARNRRGNRFFEFQGESLLLSEWAGRTGISLQTLSSRIYESKWPIEKALTTPTANSRNSCSVAGPLRSSSASAVGPRQ